MRKDFSVWKKIKLGTGFKTADDFRLEITARGYKIGRQTNNVLDKQAFIVASEETEIELVRVTVAGLGLGNGATRDRIYERAIELGLKLCPVEVGPQLRLQYDSQSSLEWIVEWILVGMEPIVSLGGGSVVFNVRRDEYGTELSCSSGSPKHFWPDYTEWVFCK